MKKLLAAGVCALAAMTAGTALAHHSAAMFDPAKQIVVQGTVKEFQYTNPHSWLIVTVPGADGKTVDWAFEAEGPSTLLRSGVKRSSFVPGEKVTVTGRPLKDGRPAALWVNATKADGTLLNPFGGRATQQRAPGQN